MTSYAEAKRVIFGEYEEKPSHVSFLFPKIPYFDLTFKKRKGIEKRILHKDIHRAFDTETNYTGDIVLLSDDQGRKVWNPDLDEILYFLSYKWYRESINWFYNLRFDIESILKHLPEEHLKEILEDSRTEYKTWKLSYIPSKYFSIADDKKHKVEFFDIAQFYHTSLDNASKEYLGDTKSIADVKGIMEYSYYDKVQKVIAEYCKHDCELTKGLAELTYKGVLDCKMPFAKPYSTASLSEIAFLKECDIPEYLDVPVGANRYAYWSYYGGWFELMKRGYHGDTIYEYDINSAYPHAMRNLADTRDLDWQRTTSIHKDAVIGMYQVILTPKRSTHISPLQIRTEKVSVHPHTSTVRYVVDDEIAMLKDVYKVKVVGGWEGFGDNVRYPFRDFVEKLYQNKADYKNKNQMMYDAVKKVLNGFYGKNIQRVDGKIGNCFNPIYAAKTTASCRRQIWEAIKDHQQEVIGIQTDSCMMTEEIDLDLGDGLGQWGRDVYSEGIFLLSGVYEMEGKKKKTKIRGYESSLRLKDMLLEKPEANAIEVMNEKPLHLKQALGYRRWAVEQTNQFIEEIKTISCAYDDKRVWVDECPDWRSFCTEQWQSEAITEEYAVISESEYKLRRMEVLKEAYSNRGDGDSGILIRHK